MVSYDLTPSIYLNNLDQFYVINVFIESGDDEDYRRGHGKSPTGLSHSTSAPGNLAPGLYPKNTRSGDRNRNDESSDDSRSTNQQDSRPGSSREKVKYIRYNMYEKMYAFVF
jgi:hypothetical protein